jgi:hypothetical protein
MSRFRIGSRPEGSLAPLGMAGSDQDILIEQLKRIAKEFLNEPDYKIKIALFERMDGKNGPTYLNIVKAYQEDMQATMEKALRHEEYVSNPNTPSMYYSMIRSYFQTNCKVIYSERDIRIDDVFNIWCLAHNQPRRQFDGLFGVMFLGPPNSGKSTLLRSLEPYQVPCNELGISRFNSKLHNFVLDDWPIQSLEYACNSTMLKQMLLGQPTTDKVASDTATVNPKWLWMTSNDTIKQFHAKLSPAMQRRWIVVQVESIRPDQFKHEDELILDFHYLQQYINVVMNEDKRERYRPVQRYLNLYSRRLALTKD